MGKSASRAFVLILLGLSLAGTDVRRPRGIYAVILAEHMAVQRSINPSITDAQLHTYFTNLYGGLLNNPAASGLAIDVKWELPPRRAGARNLTTGAGWTTCSGARARGIPRIPRDAEDNPDHDVPGL